MNRIATVALVHTGLSREVAQFQARSALMGVGFTTTEAEAIVNQPVRRRIVMLLMLFGNAGIISAIASLVLTFVDTSPTSISWPYKVLMPGGGLITLWLFATSRWVDQWLSRCISWALKKWTHIGVHDYINLLRLSNDYQVMEIPVEGGDWLANKSLTELDLGDEGVNCGWDTTLRWQLCRYP